MTKDPTEAATQVLRAHGVLRTSLPPADLREAVCEALEAAEHAETLARQCDEPGCTREASCGFPTQAGYRRTCGEHACWGQDPLSGALPDPVMI